MQLLKMKETVAFMSLRIPAMILSAVLLLGSITSLAINQLNWGVPVTLTVTPSYSTSCSTTPSEVDQLLNNSG